MRVFDWHSGKVLRAALEWLLAVASTMTVGAVVYGALVFFLPSVPGLGYIVLTVIGCGLASLLLIVLGRGLERGVGALGFAVLMAMAALILATDRLSEAARQRGPLLLLFVLAGATVVSNILVGATGLLHSVRAMRARAGSVDPSSGLEASHESASAGL